MYLCNCQTCYRATRFVDIWGCFWAVIRVADWSLVYFFSVEGRWRDMGLYQISICFTTQTCICHLNLPPLSQLRLASVISNFHLFHNSDFCICVISNMHLFHIWHASVLHPRHISLFTTRPHLATLSAATLLLLLRHCHCNSINVHHRTVLQWLILASRQINIHNI